MEYREVVRLLKRQGDDGVWAGNMLGLAPAKSQGIKDVGTVSQYRRLLELGVPTDERAFRLTDRVFYRILSRDEDPGLLFEYGKAAKTTPELAYWARELIREGATAALAQAGQAEDPRIRGSAHRIATRVSQFLRSEVADRPIVRKANRSILDPEAWPPTVFSTAMIALMPNLQRERAGFVERLAAFLSKTASKRSFVIQIGRKILKPTFHLLGDPLQVDSAGNAKDLPFALHWIELLARMGVLQSSPTAQRILARLIKDCDDQGVWSPKNLRGVPRSPSKLADFAFPLEIESKTVEQRQSDVTFRLALIAKLAGWRLDYIA